MKKNVIYFPYIRVPQNEWFTRVLLYWDKIYSIVPIEFANKPSKLGRYMYNLVQEDLVKLITPHQYIYKIPNFNEAFLEYVDNPKYPVKQGEINKKGVETSSVHIEKMGPIGDELCKRGLSIREDWQWYSIESFTANQFMAYLAASLGQLSEIKSDPITDNNQNLVSFKPHYLKDEKIFEADKVRTIILNNILPAPSGGVNPKKLAEFKNDYSKELNQFRKKIESLLRKAATIDDPLYRSEMIKQYITKVKYDMDELSTLMKSRGLKKITLTKLFAYLALAFELIGASFNPVEPLHVVALAFRAGSAISEIIQNAKSRYTAYAVLAQKKL